jgi:hypothetical protein
LTSTGARQRPDLQAHRRLDGLEEAAVMADERKRSRQRFRGTASGDAPPTRQEVAAAEAMTDTPPVIPAKVAPTGDFGPTCEQCGGMMQRT